MFAVVLPSLAATDVATASDDELGAALVEAQRAQARWAAVSAQLMAAFDARRAWAADGSVSAAAWLAQRCGLPPVEARRSVRRARRLRAMPATATALAAGEVTVAHVDRLASLAEVGRGDEFTQAEGDLVAHARQMPWRDFSRVAAYWRQCAMDADDVEAEAAADEARRSLHLSAGLRGTGILHGELTPVGRAAVSGALDAIEAELYAGDWAAVRAEVGDAATASQLARTPAQRRHDALVEMARRSRAEPDGVRAPRPLVSIVVGREAFGRMCELADGTVLTPGQAAGALADDAVVERIVRDGPARVLEVGERRSFTGALRRAIEVRDRTCTHDGCDVPAERCEVDHVVPWEQGGPTDQANGRLLCPFHHRWRHRHPPAAPASSPAAAPAPGESPASAGVRHPATRAAREADQIAGRWPTAPSSPRREPTPSPPTRRSRSAPAGRGNTAARRRRPPAEPLGSERRAPSAPAGAPPPPGGPSP